MKKTTICLFALTATLFFSCSWGTTVDTTIINNSENLTVRVKFQGHEEISIAPLQTVSMEVIRIDGRPVLVHCEPRGKINYTFNPQGRRLVINERDSFRIKILNLTGHAGTLSAGNRMNEIPFTAASLPPQTDGNWLVFTNNPQFTARITEYRFPVIVTHSLERDVDEYIFKVTICH